MNNKLKITALTALTLFIASSGLSEPLNDGFEDGDFNEWVTLSGDSVIVSQPEAINGDYSLGANEVSSLYRSNNDDSPASIPSRFDATFKVTAIPSDKTVILWENEFGGYAIYSINVNGSGNLKTGGNTLIDGSQVPYTAETSLRNYNRTTGQGDLYVNGNLEISDYQATYSGITPIENYKLTNIQTHTPSVVIDDVTYGVFVNTAPEINNAYFEPDPVEVGKQVNFYANASDIDGNLDTVSVEVSAGGEVQDTYDMSYNKNTGLWEAKNTYRAEVANYTYSFTATDTAGATDTFNIPAEEVPIEREPAESCELFGCIIQDFQASIEGIVNLEFLQKTPSEVPLWKFLVLIAGLYIAWYLIDSNSY